MSKERRPAPSGEPESDINISPLIDMVFILLIFFIVTTVFVEDTGVDVNKPQARNIARLAKNSILFAVTAENKIFYGGSEIGLGGVRPVVQRLVNSDSEMPVIIQVDQASHGSVVVRLIDEAKLGGAKEVNLSTDKSG
jgi:biopolymer transport protein ExbD